MALEFTDDGASPQSNTDSRLSTRPQTRATAFTGGTGAISAPRPTPRPFGGVPVVPNTPTPVAPKKPKIPFEGTPTTNVKPPRPIEEKQTKKGLPIKENQPAMPKIPEPKRGGVEVNPQRYRIGKDRWEINAIPEGVGKRPGIKPLSFSFGRRPELKPLLRTDGVVVKVGEHYLVSPQTLADIRDSDNPHYDITANGSVMNVTMGKTVPVIKLDISGLEATGSKRDIVNRFAGVKSVDYIYETPTVMGVPEGIVEQINYTIDNDTQRPEDRFEIWELNLTGDYSIEKLKTDTAQEDGKLDKAKLEAFTKGVSDRLQILQKDFNIIKGIFYRGELAEADRKQSLKITRRASTETDTDEEIEKPKRSNYVIKTTTTVGHSATPNTSNTTPAAGVGPLPETVTSPTDGLIPKEVNTAGLEKTKLLNDWNSYGLTPAEKSQLKAAAADNRPRNVTVPDGTTIGIGGIRFGPVLGAKLRIVLPLGILGLNSRTRPTFEQYYGTGLSDFQYNRLNDQRAAQLLQLTRKIVELERAGSKLY